MKAIKEFEPVSTFLKKLGLYNKGKRVALLWDYLGMDDCIHHIEALFDNYQYQQSVFSLGSNGECAMKGEVTKIDGKNEHHACRIIMVKKPGCIMLNLDLDGKPHDYKPPEAILDCIPENLLF